MVHGFVDNISKGFNRVHTYLSFNNSPAQNTVPVSSSGTASDAPRAPAAETSSGALQTSSQIPPTQDEVNLNGIVVTQTSDSASADDKLKQKIKNSFSDEVTVHPDTSKISGVVTPVFKNVDGNNFVYVLVPVKDKMQANAEQSVKP